MTIGGILYSTMYPKTGTQHSCVLSNYMTYMTSLHTERTSGTQNI